MRVLLDTNIVLDVLLNRGPWVADASAIWDAYDRGQVEGCILASTMTDIFYIARKAADLATAQLAVGLCLQVFTICPVDRLALEQATALPGSDFGNNLQIACAVIAGLDRIITRNPEDFAHSAVPVLTPAFFAAQL